jgi:hypothetical protein
VDYVEESEGEMIALECKWNFASSAKIGLAFRNSYPDARTGIVNPDSADTYLL